eukprot:TRINITY_DN12552_c0_g1_i4.p1 TRINITY_DN12552_c0_g1~~TRINITY_DN12552_c0_g1_i4.p1  ORF type:complete len:371 (+),score=64.67 TRINITY_DN12552_c0_g1_i4:169-1281(+)
MTLNSLLNSDGNPIRMPSEYFILEQLECAFQLTTTVGIQLKGSGKALLTSFRIILINTSMSTLNQWKSADIPIPFIHEEQFQGPVSAPSQFTGKCKDFDYETRTVSGFDIRLAKGNLRAFEFAFKEAKGKVREQEEKGVDLKFQSSLAMCIYQMTEVSPLAKGKECIVSCIQPMPYSGNHYLVKLMEKMIPGIALLESNKKPSMRPGEPEKDHAMPVAVKLLENEVHANVSSASKLSSKDHPSPPAAMDYPDLSYVFGKPADQLHENPYPKLSPIPVSVDYPPPSKPAEPIVPCSVCGRTSKPHEILFLLCGHSIHKECLAWKLKEALNMKQKLEDIKCAQCEISIEYSILHLAAPREAEKLSLLEARID